MRATLVSLLSVAAAINPGAWSLSNSTPSGDGFEKVIAKMTMDPKTYRGSGYYAAAQFTFKGGDVQYMGLQPSDPKAEGSDNQGVVYSVFGEHTSVADQDRCSGGADGGDGVSCWFSWPWKFGVEYTFESRVVKTLEDGRRQWNGTLIEEDGTRHYIASYYTGKKKGALSGEASQWLEWFYFNNDNETPETRECQPYGRVHFEWPQYDDSVGAHFDELSRNTIMDKCAVAANTPNARVFHDKSGLSVEAGFLKNDKATKKHGRL
ncbi:hypothetical protein DICA2_F37236 [Diutina catenulata]